MEYTCEGCQKKFTGTPEEAFKAGWDTPERFMAHCTCDSCPINTTVWWKIVVLKEEPTPDEVKLIQGYNRLYSEYNEVSLEGGNGEDEVQGG